VIIFQLKEQLGSATHVVGAMLGQKHVAPLLAKLRDLEAVTNLDGPGEVVVVDFGGIESATSSYLRETVGRLYRHGAASVAPRSEPDFAPLNIYPVVVGLTPEVSAQLSEVCKLDQRAVSEAVGSRPRVVSAVRIRELADAALRETVRLISAAGSATATSLFEEQKQKPPISVTAWNNRLSDIALRRIARRSRVGRQWSFAPLAREVQVNG
jgi:hypothetical protein